MDQSGRPIPPIFQEPPDPSVEALVHAMRDKRPEAPADEPKGSWEMRRYDKRNTEFWERAFARPNYTLDDLLPQRTLCAWRITRELIRSNNLLGNDETLDRLPDEAWREPIRCLPNALKEFPGLHEAAMLTEGYQLRVIEPSGDEDEQPGLALRPPPIPYAYHDVDGKVFAGYDPYSDRILTPWISTIKAVSNKLMLGVGGLDLPDIDQLGLAQLLSPETTRLAWPSPLQIVALENMMVEETLRLIVSGSMAQTIRELKGDYNLTNPECNDLIRMAKAAAVAATEGDIEEDRSIMIMRLEEFVRRAQESIDLRAELAGLKQLALIMGLSRSDLDNPMQDIIDIISQGSENRKKRRVENESRSGALPGVKNADGLDIVGSQGELIS